MVEGQDVNKAMVAGGLAWHFTRYSDDATLAAAEAAAGGAPDPTALLTSKVVWQSEPSH